MKEFFLSNSWIDEIILAKVEAKKLDYPACE